MADNTGNVSGSAGQVWLTYEQVAQRLGVEKDKVYNPISSLRRAGAIVTIQNPNDYRESLVQETDLDRIRVYMRLPGSAAS